MSGGVDGINPGHMEQKPAAYRRSGIGALTVAAGVLILAADVHPLIAHAGYVMWRRASVALTRFSYRTWPRLDAAHFTIYYPRGQGREAQTVKHALEQALPREEHSLGIQLTHSIPVVLYTSAARMNQSVGESPAVNNIGYDYRGVIDLLSPSAWLGTSPTALHTFLLQGPTAHELGHALLNLKADMNYPAWFNEGVAQYEDLKVTGWEWITPTNRLTGPLYSLAELDQNFYGLANQSRAYRQGLALVQFLVHQRGPASFRIFLNRLGRGQAFNSALRAQYHFSSPEALYRVWRGSLHPET